jgi:TM2 domain-containing membrane protein YozV
MSIGRDPANNDIALEDERVSRQHAQVQVQDTAVIIADVGSRNGTFVNGQPVTGWQSINPGDVISIGGLQLAYQAEHDIGATQALDAGQPQPSPAPAPPAQPVPYPYPVPQPASRPQKDRSLAIVLEVLPGLFGILGIGWMYAGNINTGLAVLVGNLIFLAISAVIAVLTAGIGLCILWPMEIVILVLSATQLNKYTRKHPELFGT